LCSRPELERPAAGQAGRYAAIASSEVQPTRICVIRENDKHQMKKLLTSLLICVLLPAGHALSADLDAPYTPTRAEWLRIYLAENIKISTDSWPVRVRVMVTVVNKNQQVLITLMPAYGEKKPTREQREAFVAMVTDMAKRVLESYAWSKDLKVDVSFV